VIAWIKQVLSESDGTPSTKRHLFWLVVVALLLYLGYDLRHHGITETWSTVAMALIASTGGAFTIGRFAENKQDTK
jgi:hypothetical protein